MINMAVDKNFCCLFRMRKVPLYRPSSIKQVLKQISEILHLGGVVKVEFDADGMTYYQHALRSEIPTDREWKQLVKKKVRECERRRKRNREHD